MSQYIVPAVTIAGLLALVGMMVIGKSRDHRNAALVIFIGPVLLALVAYDAGSFYADAWGPVLRVLFLYTVIVLPGGLFFVFVALRKENLFNAYVANLERLGLLRRRKMDLVGRNSNIEGAETDWSFKYRISAYLDRFRSLYGRSQNEEVVLNRALERAGVVSKTPVAGEPAQFPPEVAILSATEASGHDPDGAGGAPDRRVETFTVRTVLPVVFATLLIGLGWCTVLPPFPDDYAKPPHNWAWAFAQPLGSSPSFAFLGAYFFSLNMIVRRFMLRDLGPNAYNAISLRVIISVLIVWALEQIMGLITAGTAVPALTAAMPGAQAITVTAVDKAMLAFAFVVGVFPYIGWSLLGTGVRKFNDLIPIIPNLTGTQPLSQLDGLTIWHESRLAEEDIENVPNMANADLPDLMLDTKMPPHRLVAWVDQAILICAIDPDDEAAPPKDASRQGAPTPAADPAALRGSDDRTHMLWSLRKSFNDAGIRSASALLEIFDPVAAPRGAPRDYAMYNATAAAASGHPALRVFQPSQIDQVCAIAASVAQAPNISMIRTWLAIDYKDWPPAAVVKLAAE
jgi:hypothetical protein